MVIWWFRDLKITRSPDHKIRQPSEAPPVHENKEQLQFPNEELDYQPEPDTVAGFIASMEMKVDELLAAANWQPQ
jgi:hypothetical protein